MNTTNIKEGDLIICTNSSMNNYLKISEIIEINRIPNDGHIESIIISYLMGKCYCDYYSEFIKTETIPYRDFEFNFKKIITDYAY
jgi:hypothetical protein